MTPRDDDGAPPPAPGAVAGGLNPAAFFAHSPVAILIADGQGRLLDVNPAACELTGYDRAELLALGLAALGPPGGTAGATMYREVVAGARQAAELRLRRRDGTLRWVQADGVPLASDRFVAFCRDVTARRAAEEALRREHALLDEVMETSPVAIVTLDRDGVLTRLNRRAAQELALPPEALGRTRWDSPEWSFTTVDGEPLPPAGLPFAAVLGGAVVHDLRVAVHWPERPRRVLSINAAPLRGDDGVVTGVVCVFEDVTARVAAERELEAAAARLRELASAASLAEERERRRAATDLHDRIAQPLAMAKLRLQAIVPRLADAGVAATLGEVCELLDGALGDTRNLTFALSSPILYDLGFEAALEWLAEQLQTRHGLACRFVDDGAPKPLAEDLRVVLYQAVRELCTNIVKHAHARSASISVARAGDAVRVEVADDGVGFPPEVLAARAAAARGFGLFSLRERLRFLGATLTLGAAPGTGSQVVILAPLCVTPGGRAPDAW